MMHRMNAINYNWTKSWVLVKFDKKQELWGYRGWFDDNASELVDMAANKWPDFRTITCYINGIAMAGRMKNG